MGYELNTKEINAAIKKQFGQEDWKLLIIKIKNNS